jgi:hypothetical protein
MKYAILSLLLIAALTSCENTWDSESKEMFHQSCMEDALTWASTQDNAKKYCDCVLDRTMARYPKMADALRNIDSVITDPNIKGCRAEVE